MIGALAMPSSVPIIVCKKVVDIIIYVGRAIKNLTVPRRIYPMHGSLPVGKDLIAKLLSGAEQIKAGSSQAQSRDVVLFGRTVKLYDFGYAVFLCE